MVILKIVQTLDKLNNPEWTDFAASVLGPDIHPERRETFCFAREALRLALCELDYNPEINDLVLHGYHSLKKYPELTFSLAHTKKTGVALLGHQREFRSLGVDVELATRPVKDSIRDRIAHPADEKLRNIEAWVLKEAVFKCVSNSGLLANEPLYPDLCISRTGWQHTPSGLKGECELSETGDLLLGKAFLRA
jgi:hypothetical protein